MKKILFLIGLGLLLLPTIASAADLDNYYYAHANEPGSYVLTDKYNHNSLYGDYAQDDATINQISFRSAHGLSGEIVTITTRDGRSYEVDPSRTFVIPEPKPKSVTITLKKTTYAESFLEISYFSVFDQSNGGVSISYTFTGDSPTSYGDLGAGQAPATPTPTPTPGTPTPTPTSSNQMPQLMAYKLDNNIVWQTEPTNTDYIEVYRDGVQVATIQAGVKEYNLGSGDINGTYNFKVISLQGNLIATTLMLLQGYDVATPGPSATATASPTPTDPGGGTTPTDPPCTESCQNIIDVLECPEFDEYLGKWADMIRTTYPPPPDWYQVADIMRDTIVPSMGQEIVNRSPEIADIIADEFQSRERPVQPPQPVSTYAPPQPLPTIKDMPQAVPFDLGDQSTTFEPDYTESKPFTIPDPAAVQFSDTDSGYTYPAQTNDSSPDYKSESKIDPDKGYQGKPSADTSTPTYQVTNPIVNDPGPEYYYINGGQTQIPIYKKKDTTVTSPGYVNSPDATAAPPNYNP